MSRKFFYTIPAAIGTSLLINLVPLTVISSDLGRELLTAQAQDQAVMTSERLGDILQDDVGDVQGSAGQWQLTLEEQTMVVLADDANNRMRIVAPIGPAEALSVEQVEAILGANFHSALDARYAVTNGTVVAVYVHPLASLQANDFRSALRQVATLAATFGSTYTSGDLGFGPAAAPAESPQSIDGLIGI